MADDTQLGAPSGTGDVISTDDLGLKKVQRVKVQYGVDGSATDASTTNPLPVDQTNTSVADGGVLPAKGVQVGGTDGSVFQVLSTDNAGRLNTNINGTVPVSGPLTDTQLRATAVPVSGTVTASGPLTDAQLRATAVPVSGTVTASGPLTDTQLRASAVPVSGTVTASGPLTDTQLRATAVPTSLATLPALTTGSAVIGSAGLAPQTSGGLSIFHLVSAATTNATNVKASAGQLFGWYIYNSNAAARKVAFHNTAGTPTAGASVSFSVVIPPSSAANVEYTNGVAFGTGIAITTVTELTDAGTTAVAASDLIINLFYK